MLWPWDSVCARCTRVRPWHACASPWPLRVPRTRSMLTGSDHAGAPVFVERRRLGRGGHGHGGEIRRLRNGSNVVKPMASAVSVTAPSRLGAAVSGAGSEGPCSCVSTFGHNRVLRLRRGVRVSVVNWQRAGMADVDGRNRQARAEELKEGEALGVLVLTKVEADGGDIGSMRERRRGSRRGHGCRRGGATPA